VSDCNKAPRRPVVTRLKTSGYGATWWVATLECGHVQRRKREPATSMGCTECLKENRALVDILSMPSGDTLVEVQDPSIEASLLSGTIANRLDLPVEFVTAHVDESRISGFMAWIPYHAAKLMSSTTRKGKP